MILSNIEYRKIEYDFPNIRANHTAKVADNIFTVVYLLSVSEFMGKHHHFLLYTLF